MKKIKHNKATKHNQAADFTAENLVQLGKTAVYIFEDKYTFGFEDDAKRDFTIAVRRFKNDCGGNYSLFKSVINHVCAELYNGENEYILDWLFDNNIADNSVF